MKAYSELIEKYRDQLAETMRDRYATVIRCAGRVLYHVYLWDDGEIETLEDVPGSNSWLKAKDSETRELYYVLTVKEPNFDWRDCCCDQIPDESEDPEGYEAMKEETEDWVIGEYDPSEAIDLAIEDAEREEAIEEAAK